MPCPHSRMTHREKHRGVVAPCSGGPAAGGRSPLNIPNVYRSSQVDGRRNTYRYYHVGAKDYTSKRMDIACNNMTRFGAYFGGRLLIQNVMQTSNMQILQQQNSYTPRRGSIIIFSGFAPGRRNQANNIFKFRARTTK